MKRIKSGGVKKRILSTAAAAALFVSMFGGATVGDRVSASQMPEGPKNSGGNVVWDCVYFGRYPQSDASGSSKDAIKWRVLSVENGEALLQADSNLDVYHYYDALEEITWEDSLIRYWLNAGVIYNSERYEDYRKDGFLAVAFTDAEKNAIADTTVVNSNNPQQADVDGGNDTTDKVFLLSYVEATNSAYGFSASGESADAARIRKNTAYVAAGGKTGSTYMSAAGQPGIWWLRSPGVSGANANIGLEDGRINADGTLVYSEKVAVCPALRLKLSSSDVWTYAGTVASDGSTTPGEAPPDQGNGQSDTQQEATQQPVTERPTTQQEATQQPVTERPTTQQETTRQPVTERPTTQQETTRQPVTERPTTQQEATQQPVTERPTTQQEATRQPVTERPTTQQEATEASATGEMTSQEPVTEQSTAGKDDPYGSTETGAGDGASTEAAADSGENTSAENLPGLENNTAEGIWPGGEQTTVPETPVPEIEQKLPDVGTSKTISGCVYRVTASTAGKKTVTLVKSKNSGKKKVRVPATVNLSGQSYKVTKIGEKAFQKHKKLNAVVIGKNVSAIGKQAFYGCKKLKRITIKGTGLKSVGQKALKGIQKKAVIKVPKKKLALYRKLFKKKTGFQKGMKVKA